MTVKENSAGEKEQQIKCCGVEKKERKIMKGRKWIRQLEGGRDNAIRNLTLASVK